MEYKIHVKIKKLGKILDKLNELGYDFRSTIGNSLRRDTEHDIRKIGRVDGRDKVWLYLYTDDNGLMWDFLDSSGRKIKFKEFINLPIHSTAQNHTQPSEEEIWSIK